ncbi:hypothetical protein B0J14DRAFT_578724 [Halenospora varia]|nr:hypothetical protein B0J14DRAFT_578724 [Halenospora varia]
MIVKISVGLGFNSWRINNTATPTSFLQEPKDIECIPAPFNISSWLDVPSTHFILSLLHGLGKRDINDIPPTTKVLDVILATLDHTGSKHQLDQKYPLSSNQIDQTNLKAPPECSLAKNSSNKPWVISGMISNHGTEMTSLGVALQVFILIFCAIVPCYYPGQLYHSSQNGLHNG